MTDDTRAKANPPTASGSSIPNRVLGALRDALAAASRAATGEITVGQRTEILPKDPPPAGRPAAQATPPVPPTAPATPPPPVQSAADAVREAKAPGRGHYEAAEP